MMFPEDFAPGQANGDTQPFWDACRRRELRFQRCQACQRFRHPPIPGCPHCGSVGVDWQLVSGRGEIFSYTIVHHPTLPSLAPHVPYNVIVVEFAEAPGVRLISNLTEIPPAGIAVGMPVALVWDPLASGLFLPRFRPAA